MVLAGRVARKLARKRNYDPDDCYDEALTYVTRQIVTLTDPDLLRQAVVVWLEQRLSGAIERKAKVGRRRRPVDPPPLDALPARSDRTVEEALEEVAHLLWTERDREMMRQALYRHDDEDLYDMDAFAKRVSQEHWERQLRPRLREWAAGRGPVPAGGGGE